MSSASLFFSLKRKRNQTHKSGRIPAVSLRLLKAPQAYRLDRRCNFYSVIRGYHCSLLSKKGLVVLIFDHELAICLLKQFLIVSERLGSNFLEIHLQNVDQIRFFLVRIAKGKSGLKKKKEIFMAVDPNIFRRKFFS